MNWKWKSFVGVGVVFVRSLLIMILLPREELFRAATFPVEVTARNSLGQVCNVSSGKAGGFRNSEPLKAAGRGTLTRPRRVEPPHGGYLSPKI